MKMIKINNSDTLIDIVDMIANCKDNRIILEFSFGNHILYNYVSLKIIKNKCLGKNLIIVTNDLSAKKIGTKLGINYNIINKADIKNSLDIAQYNFSFLGYLKFQTIKYIQEIKNIFKKDKINQLNIDILIEKTKTRLGFFISIFTISVFTFFFIFYFAVNKTVVFISPEKKIKTRSKNIIFTKKEDLSYYKENTVEIKEIFETIYLKEKFGTSGIKMDKKDLSSGEVIIYNSSNQDIKLLNNTRLQSKKGVVYRTKGQVNIEKAVLNKKGNLLPGEITVKVISDFFDNKGVIIGKRGNVSSGVLLSIPGLKDNINKKNIYGYKIYAKTKNDIKGGKNKYKKILAENDIINGKKIFEDKLKQTALNKIKDRIKKDNIVNNITYDILGIDNIIKYTNLEIGNIGNIDLGDEIDFFSLSGSIKINTYIYNKNTLINKIRSVINDSVMQGEEKITYINGDSIRISNIIYKKNNPYEIKATVEIEISVSHNFDNEDSYYVDKLKNIILGLKKDDAIKILLNEEKINGVNVAIRPFFIKKISNIINNIEFKLE